MNMKLFRTAMILMMLNLFFTAAPCLACTRCTFFLFPIDPFWIITIILALTAVNYFLIYNKMNFIIDCGLCLIWILMLLSFMIFKIDDVTYSGNAIILIATFFVTLILTTARVLNRHELSLIFTRSISLISRGFIVTTLFVVIALWSTAYLVHPLFQVGFSSSNRENLKQVGAALDLYSAAHEGRYPDSLDRLIPEYVREINRGRYTRHTGREGVSIVKDKENAYFCDYSASDDRLNYTLQCSSYSYDDKSPFSFLYTRERGFSISKLQDSSSSGPSSPPQ